MKTWYAVKAGNDHQGIVCDETGRSVAVAYDVADTALLSAAPDLLDALEKVEELWHDLYAGMADDGERELWNNVRTAIAKAKGE